MHASEVTSEAIERANRLYWESTRSVNQIAEELELSKGALYGIIEPEPSGQGCPLCGDEVVYSNRTARERERLDCPTCDWDGSPDETTSDVEAVAARPGPSDPVRPESGDAAGPAAEGDQGGERPRRPGGIEDREPGLDEMTPPRPYVRPAASTIAGGALLGAAVGLALVMWARRR